MQLECYICHELVKRHEYNPHIASHLAGDGAGSYPWLGPTPGYPGIVHYDHVDAPFLAHATTSPRPRDRTARGPERAHLAPNAQLWPNGPGNSVARDPPADNHQETHSPSSPPGRSRVASNPTESNAFHIWRKNYVSVDGSHKYTTVDGQKRNSELPAFRQASEILRDTSKGAIVRIVEQFEGFPSRVKQKICLDLVRRTPIFPGLVAYTYTHLTLCQRSGWLRLSRNDDWSGHVSELQQLVRQWSRYDDVWCILSCDAIKEELVKILDATKIRPGEHRCNSALLNGAMVVKYDILNLAGLAALCTTGPQREDMLNQKGVQAGKLIELFHDLLESNAELEQCYRRCFFNAIIPISKRSGRCPRSIYIPEGTISDLAFQNQGGFGIVHKGKLGSRLVAVKTLRRDDTTSLSDYSEQVSKEAIVWRYLRHPNCLPLYGIYSMASQGQKFRIALVSPWMDQGTLVEYLERNPGASRTKLILDTVKGLNYLHTMEPHVAHRDIKPDNILVTSKGHACLADFGLASTFDTTDHMHTVASKANMCGTPYYMAPEIFCAALGGDRRRVNKRACDMYALGCTIYAVYTGRAPFEGLPRDQLPARVMKDERPEFPAGKISPDMWSFVESLWHFEPLQRLTAPMALDWMKTKATYEDIDTLDGEGWQWQSQLDDKSLWSVPL